MTASGTSVYQLASDGAPSLAVNIAGAKALNGLTPFGPDTFLAADDTADVIWKVNVKTGTASVWLTDPLLVAPAFFPIGPNG